MKVPFLDLKAHHDPLKAEILEGISRVVDSNAFANGPFVAKFEEEFAGFCGAKHALGVGSGTEALWLSLLAFEVGPGDEVITAPMTFIATAEAISFCGAKPVFVDIDPRTYTLDPALVEAAITERTKAIIPVHLYGQTADLDPILAIAENHNLVVIEDAAQAHGALYKGRRAGSIGHTGCFSFYPGKNLGAFGEGGAVVTDDPAVGQRIAALRDHGQSRKHHHSWIGWNSRMDGIQAVVLSVKLKRLELDNRSRRAHAAIYDDRLAGLDGVVTPAVAEYASHVYHLYPIRVSDREAVLDRLQQRGIGCGIHYPIPVHLQEAYQFLGYQAGAFPVSEACAGEVLSLPMFPELTEPQIEAVTSAVAECVSE